MLGISWLIKMKGSPNTVRRPSDLEVIEPLFPIVPDFVALRVCFVKYVAITVKYDCKPYVF